MFMPFLEDSSQTFTRAGARRGRVGRTGKFDYSLWRRHIGVLPLEQSQGRGLLDSAISGAIHRFPEVLGVLFH
jgi:hypothetical protein